MIQQEYKPQEDEFVPFPKIGRVFREIVITEKIDGTNAQIYIKDDGISIQAGSRHRWITPENDNYGFAKWVQNHNEELLKLGPGRHYGEWYGLGIQRGYGLQEKRFALFNTARWSNPSRPSCCGVVPVLYAGDMDTTKISSTLESLKQSGSIAVPGYMNPEGIVVYHSKTNSLWKVTFDDKHKEEQ